MRGRPLLSGHRRPVVVGRALAFYALGKCAFFALGNSHLTSTLEVGPVFDAVSAYNTVRRA